MVTSLLNQTPTNLSTLQSTKYTFSFPTMPFLRYFMQTVSLPSISTNEVQVANPFADTFRHGDKLVFEPLTISTLVDEDLEVVRETKDWLFALTKPNDFYQYNRFVSPEKHLYHDAILTINTNSNIPNLRIKFTNCHPTSLGSVFFNVSDSADVTPVVDVTFRYDTFDFERINT